MTELPVGTVTFLFTDIEGSTRLWEDHPDAMRSVLARHDELLRTAIESNAGYVVKTTGDGAHAAFSTATDAVDAAVAAQLAVTDEAWTLPDPLRVRMGLHTGPAELRDGDYYGTAVNKSARIMSIAHGGQIVMSDASRQLLGDTTVETVDLGEHRLKDLGQRERIFQVSHSDLSQDFPPLRSLDSYSGNLPAQVTSFVGRAAELVAVAAALDTARLVTLTGVGGVGKTRLSLQVAAEVLPRFPQGAWFCELAAATDSDSLAQVVATALGVTPLAGMTLDRSIVEFLRAKTELLVFDNCEHLLDEISRLAESILRECPNVRLLASSREGLGVPGEQMVAVRSLPMPDADGDFVAVAQSDAVLLFAERAAAARNGFTLESANAAAVVEICRRLDGIPLAIELAAARVSAMNPSDIATRIDERFRLLTGGRRTGIERHQTLRATVDWSYSLLAPAEQAVFDRLGVFAGDFSGTAAEAVASGDGVESWDVLDALAGLVAKSMITIDDSAEGAARYRMLETLRAYAREQLDLAGTTDLWRRRHAEHYTEFAEQLGPALISADEFAARRRFRAELDNLRAAVTWALDADDPADQHLGLRVIAELGYEVTMDRRAGIGTWAEHALERIEHWEEPYRAAIFAIAGMNAATRGEWERAEAWTEAACAGGISVQAPVAMLPWITQGSLDVHRGRQDRATRLMAETFAAFDAGGDDFQRSNLLAVRANYLLTAGNAVEALVDSQRSLHLARQLGNPSQLAIALAAAGWALLALGRLDEASAALEESVALTRAGASDVMFGHALGYVAAIWGLLGDASRCLAGFQDAVRHFVDCGDHSGLSGAMTHGAAPLVAIGEPALAVAFCAVARGQGVEIFAGGARATTEQALAAARDSLGPDEYDSLWARCEAMSYDDAVAHILAELDTAIASSTSSA